MPDKLGPTLATEVRVGDFVTSKESAFRQCFKIRLGRFHGYKGVRLYFRNGDRLTVAQDALIMCWRFRDYDPNDEVAIGVETEDES